MFGPDDLERIEVLWEPSEWPAETTPYSKSGYRRPFAYHIQRVNHLGLSGGLLVDAGCGGGQWTFAWATRFERVIGFDAMPRRLATAIWQKERFQIAAVEFVGMSTEKIPVENKTADVLCYNSGISGSWFIERELREFFRVLKPGGLCYLALTGPGFANEQASRRDPRLVERGRNSIYNTLCQRHFSSLAGDIAPGGPRNGEVAAALQRGGALADLLVSIDCRPHQLVAAESITTDLGPEFAQRLLDDIAAIGSGTKTDFGDRRMGRYWDVDEVSVAARNAGFARCEYGPYGWLSLQPDGSIDRRPCPAVEDMPREFEGQPRIFEMLLWRPPKAAKRARRPLETASAGSPDTAKIRARPAGEWKVTLGRTTFWNAGSDEISTPIIDPTPPGFAELEGAIITPREIEAKLNGARQSRLRPATGGVYDRHHNLLPVFLQREAFEATAGIRNPLKNPHVLSKDDLLDAQFLKGEHVYLGVLRPHFGHFLLEALCKMWILLKSRPNAKIIMHSASNSVEIRPFMAYILELFEIDVEQIIIANNTFIIEHLIFPQSEFEIRWKARFSYSDTFTELFERSMRRFPAEARPRRVYLTRRQLQTKKTSDLENTVANEVEVERLFIQRGFKVIAPEKLPFHEQIAIAGHAHEIAGLKGSALHMSLFSQYPQARLIQIGRKQSMNQCLIDGLKNMESHHIFCESPETAAGSVVDLEILSAALGEI